MPFCCASQSFAGPAYAHSNRESTTTTTTTTTNTDTAAAAGAEARITVGCARANYCPRGALFEGKVRARTANFGHGGASSLCEHFAPKANDAMVAAVVSTARADAA